MKACIPALHQPDPLALPHSIHKTYQHPPSQSKCSTLCSSFYLVMLCYSLFPCHFSIFSLFWASFQSSFSSPSFYSIRLSVPCSAYVLIQLGSSIPSSLFIHSFTHSLICDSTHLTIRLLSSRVPDHRATFSYTLGTTTTAALCPAEFIYISSPCIESDSETNRPSEINVKDC